MDALEAAMIRLRLGKLVSFGPVTPAITRLEIVTLGIYGENCYSIAPHVIWRCAGPIFTRFTDLADAWMVWLK